MLVTISWVKGVVQEITLLSQNYHVPILCSSTETLAFLFQKVLQEKIVDVFAQFLYAVSRLQVFRYIGVT